MNTYLIASLIILFNLLVSTCVVRDKRRSLYERIAEVGLIWLLPVFGGLISMSVSCRDPEREKQFQDIEKSFKSLR